MNGGGKPRRPDGVRGRCRAPQLHARGGEAACHAIGPEPDRAGIGGAAGDSAAEPDNTQRIADLRAAGPRLEEIQAEMAALRELRDKPSGTVRITAHDHAVRAVLWPAFEKLLPDYRDIKVEVVIDYGLTESWPNASMPAFPDMRSAIVGAPSYFPKRTRPKTPQDLTAHACINLRLPTHGGLYAWEFEKGGREIRVRVEG